MHRENNSISVWNNGKGIPVVEHKVEKVYVPALIFGQLLTSSNYDDEQKKVTGEYMLAVDGLMREGGLAHAQGLTGLSLSGGRNGYGAKLCNIFSTQFTVETACRESKNCFKQVRLLLAYWSLAYFLVNNSFNI